MNDKVRINYIVEGSGFPLVILHGNGESLEDLRNQINEFSLYYKVIAIDSRAHGLSDMGNEKLTYALMCNDVINVLNKLGIEKAIFFGFSDGGIIALLLAINHPDLMDRMIVVGANTKPSGFKFKVRCDFFMQRYRQKKRIRKKQGGLRKYWLYDLMLKEPNISNVQLQQIECPVLLIAGENDMVRHQHTLDIHKNIKDSKLVIIPKGDHFLPMKNFEEVNTLSIEWLS